jgi:16S rRNA (adenine1518-N6/adenine1519-N6)-dimethyltransferase
MAKQKLGQHFLFDKNILKKIVKALNIDKNEAVLEIGAGRGTLTDELAVSAKKVFAVEIDNYLCHFLNEKFASVPNVTIIKGDIMAVDIEEIPAVTAVGNIPYYITTPIIFKLIDATKIKRFALLMQKEVANRIVAGEGSRDYGILSVNAQFQTEPRVLLTVKKTAFSPPPKIDSALVLFNKKNVDKSLAEKVRTLVKTAFSMRRKTLHNNLKKLFGDKTNEFLKKFAIEENARPEEIPVDIYAAMARQMLADGI